MIARKIAIDDLCLTEPALPLDTLDHNIVCQDALFSEWVKADAIIGNPPFLGGHRIRQNLGDDYAEKIFSKFPEVKDKVDFCSYWLRLSHEYINAKGRVGLVGTNTISQGNTRRAGLDYITQNSGIIHNAISSQVWSGDAKVHVSIVNWCYQKPQVCYLNNQTVRSISSSLQSTIDVSIAIRLQSNLDYSFKGIQPSGKGFIVTETQVNKWIQVESKNKVLLKLLLSGADLTDKPNGIPSRWIIDFNDMTLEEASDYEIIFAHIQNTVKIERENNRREVTKLNWWQYGEKRPGMRKAIKNISCYFVVPRHSKWFIFIPGKSDWLPADSTTVIASDDFYILGILTSNVHRVWVKAQSSTLEDRTRYTHNTCFETFPFPQTVDIKIVQQIRTKTEELHEYRSQQMETKQWGITTLYNKFFTEPSSQLYKLHQQLDKLVMSAYQFNPEDDILERLLLLNLELAEKEKQGIKIIGPEIQN
ncbi:DNA modification methyltransferase [Dolichospermum planctonicum]|uniref:site-specific DNA-methyltransferase (adenine-specific) n=2 Tax=Dolichospermum planctonicum TaxID=136072 RepID=A0A480AKH2_9CYAN|nr:DNA modification methyltransferase [Dolichospermum planctonicum]